jgi:hypothetical protein
LDHFDAKDWYQANGTRMNNFTPSQPSIDMEISADAFSMCPCLSANSTCMHSGTFPVVVSMFNGEIIEFEVVWDELVAEFKMKLGQIVDVAPYCQTLLCCAGELENHYEIGRYAVEVPLLLTLVVRVECPPEVVQNTKELLTALRVGMAPRPYQQKALVRSLRPRPKSALRSGSIGPSSDATSNGQPFHIRINAQARKLVPGKTPAARKLREHFRRKALAKEVQLHTTRYPYYWPQRRYTTHLSTSYEQASWAGLEADMERKIQNYEVDLDRFQVLKAALTAGCGELALLCLRYGADPCAVSMAEALKYFRRSSDPLEPSVETVFRNSAEGFTLARAICDLWQRQAALSIPPADPLAAARARLARAATELALLQHPFGREHITKQAASHAAGLSPVELDAYGDDLLAGWPMAFLTFSEPTHGHCKRLDPDFMRVRACLVASSTSQSKGETSQLDNWINWTPTSSWGSHEQLLDDLNPEQDPPSEDEYNMWKFRNRKWSNITKRRVTRVPWVTAKGTSTSRSSKMARRLPKYPGQIQARGQHHRKNHTNATGWDEYCMM